MSVLIIRHSKQALIAIAALSLLYGLGPAHAASELVYQVHDSKYGNIGTYSNVINKTGDATTVTTTAEFKVAILGIVLYRQEILRVERWIGDRLVSFHGTTTENGKPFTVDGMADGDHFKVATPDGNLTVPSSVRIANPWSENALKGDTMLTPDRGTVENVRVSQGVETEIAIAGRSIPATQYEIVRGEGPKKYEVWMDKSGTPVKFDVVNPGSTVTFSLML